MIVKLQINNCFCFHLTIANLNYYTLYFVDATQICISNNAKTSKKINVLRFILQKKIHLENTSLRAVLRKNGKLSKSLLCLKHIHICCSCLKLYNLFSGFGSSALVELNHGLNYYEKVLQI